MPTIAHRQSSPALPDPKSASSSALRRPGARFDMQAHHARGNDGQTQEILQREENAPRAHRRQDVLVTPRPHAHYNPKARFDCLPTELLACIAEHLRPLDTLSMSQISRSCRSTFSYPPIWEFALQAFHLSPAHQKIALAIDDSMGPQVCSKRRKRLLLDLCRLQHRLNHFRATIVPIPKNVVVVSCTRAIDPRFITLHTNRGKQTLNLFDSTSNIFAALSRLNAPIPRRDGLKRRIRLDLYHFRGWRPLRRIYQAPFGQEIPACWQDVTIRVEQKRGRNELFVRFPRQTQCKTLGA